MKRRQWYWLGGSLLLLGLVKLVLVGWYLHKTPPSVPVEQAKCPAQSSVCQLPGGVRLRFIDPPNEKQAFTLALEGVTEEPSAEFSMLSMDMGFNRYRFVRAHDRWEARVTLPACVSGSHDWLMTLNFNGRRVQLPLPIHP